MSSFEIGVQTAKQPPEKAADTTPDNPWPVSRLSLAYHNAVERWPATWIEGQIQEINTRRAGSAYITLRDNTEDVTVQVSGWRMFAAQASQFIQGDQVVVHGHPDVWMKRTSLSFIGDDIRRVGKGDLRQQLEELRKKLKGEGLFDESHKVPIPEFPHRIGVICAPQARAEGDIVTNARLRWPTINFTIEHVHVQGAQCPPEVIEAIRKLDADPDIDVIIVARGGGSFEDLIGFSDEGVVRAAAACVTPIVSAIGHEDDWTLIDLAADMRASTPTDAAKRIVPDVMEQLALVDEARRRIRQRIRTAADTEQQRIDAYRNHPSLTHPQTILERPQLLINDSARRLDVSMRRLADEAGFGIEKLHASLTALSPQSTLDRGYAVVQNADGHVIDDPASLSVGDKLTITLRRGKAGVSVDSTDPDPADAENKM
ncbi:MAG: exodeoxyribonuclease VII large subunit [Scardovia wiggsiae]